MRWARHARALAAPMLLLAGCGQQIVSVEPPARPRTPIGAAPVRAGFVIAASQADPLTSDLAAELARRTGFALVVAPGAAVDPERVREAAGGPVRFYTELRGTERREPPNRIAIGTVGVDDNLAARLRTLYELIRDAYVRAHPGTPMVDVLVAPADVPGGASVRSLLLEVPRVTRGEARESYTAILADFLAQAATLPAGR